MGNSVRYVITVDREGGSVLKVEQLDQSGALLDVPYAGTRDLLERVVGAWSKEKPGQQNPPRPSEPTQVPVPPRAPKGPDKPKPPEGPQPPMGPEKPKPPRSPEGPQPPMGRRKRKPAGGKPPRRKR